MNADFDPTLDPNPGGKEGLHNLRLDIPTIPGWLIVLHQLAQAGKGAKYRIGHETAGVVMIPSESMRKTFSYLTEVEEVWIIYGNNKV